MNGEYPNYPREMVEEFEAQIAALTKERDVFAAANRTSYDGMTSALGQLAASQAREQQLREALEPAKNGLEWFMDRFTDAYSSADDEMLEAIAQALSLPQDDTALRQWGTRLLRETRDECAVSNNPLGVFDRKANELEAGK